MPEVKRGRGRSRKEEEPPEVKNPDCETATKGYVKCLLRKISAASWHQHDITDGDLRESLLVISGGALLLSGLVWALLGSALAEPVVQINNVWLARLTCEWAQSICGASVVILLAVGMSAPPTVLRNCAIPSLKEIRKYEPPTCEKKECE